MPPEISRVNCDVPSRDALLASWRRSAAAGLLETEDVRPKMLSRSDLVEARHRCMKVLKYAEPSIENTYEQMAGTSSVVLLADAEAQILYIKGDDDFMSGPHGRFFLPGVCLGEGVAGTNAIGTCIASREPVAVDKVEHYALKFRSLCGTAAPIFDSSGLLVAVLATYSTTTVSHLHTLGFIRTVAVLIENRVLVREMADQIVVHFHPVEEYIGTIKQGIVVFGHDGGLRGSNCAARSLMRLSLADIPTKRFKDLFAIDCEAERLVEKARMGAGQFTTSLADGREVTILVSAGASREVAAVPGSMASDELHTDRESLIVKKTDYVLQDLDLGDPMMQRAIQKASMIVGSDIPLLIEGESGVGKEVFTAAFHHSGPRKRGPFVAVNCAAIPETLIESELFGYEEGAFTGAKKRGYQGKILQANGGTLFLDEIGDMPLSLQGRLLRVIQEREITPLGSSKTVPVNISIVCATHRKMLDEVSAGRFREDLYYRLNGLRVQLPPLRWRTDIYSLIEATIEAHSRGRKIEIAPEVRTALARHPWPGNIREMQMVLRTALFILGAGSVLTLDHLPEEFDQSKNPQTELAPLTGPKEGEGDLAQIESAAIQRALNAAGGNISKTARVLGISRKTLYRKLAQSMDTPDERCKPQVEQGK